MPKAARSPWDIIAPPAYFAGLLIVLVPSSDALMTVWPLNLGSAYWRFGAVGVTSRELLLPLIGIGSIAALATALRHKKRRIATGVLATMCSLALWGTIVLYLLDAFQVRGSIRPQFITQFDLAAGLALLRLLGLAVLSSIIARSTLSRRSAELPARAQTAVQPAWFMTPGSESLSQAGI